MSTIAKEMTLGTIAERFNAPVHLIADIVGRLGLQESSRAGRLRIFDESTIQVIEREIERRRAVRQLRSSRPQIVAQT